MSTPREHRARFGWKKTLVFSLLPALLLVAVLEGAARIFELWAPPRTVDIGQGFTEESRLFVPGPDNPDMLVTSPNKVVDVRGQQLFRPQAFAREKKPDTFRAFFLGGSSVNYLDYELPMLEKRLAAALPAYEDAEIINCGGLSYGSHRLVRIAAEVLSYAPDAILIYSGHNEFEELEQYALSKPASVPLQKVLSHSALYRVVRDRIAALQLDRLERNQNARIARESIPDSARAWGYDFSEEEVEARAANYQDNLARIMAMCRDADVAVIIGTVPSNLVRPALPGPPGERYEAEVIPLFEAGRYAEGKERAREILGSVARHQASAVENDIIRGLAERLNVPLADVEQAVTEAEPHGVPGETLFNDHCHLNAEGNKLLIREYEEQLRQLFG